MMRRALLSRHTAVRYVSSGTGDRSPWLPNAALKKVSEGQRSAFFTLLRVHDFLVPADEQAASSSVDALGRPAGEGIEVAERVKRHAAEECDALIAKHANLLPEGCERAPAHLQMAALAISAHRAMLREASKVDYYGYAAEDHLLCRRVVAGALGVHAEADGSPPHGSPVMWLPNRIALTLTFDKDKVLRRMVDNFAIDLGRAFELESLEPAPSCRMKYCLYTEVLRAEGEPLLMPIFWALHGATFAGVPGYEFEPPEFGDGDVGCTFWFGRGDGSWKFRFRSDYGYRYRRDAIADSDTFARFVTNSSL